MVFLNINKNTNNEDINYENTDNQNTDNQNTDNQDTDNQDTDNKDTDNQDTDNQDTDNEKNKKNKKLLTTQLSDYIRKGSNIFILIYMNGCGPCNETRPEWKKIENVLKKYKNSKDVVIVDIDHELLDKVKENNITPNGFPTIKYISNKGKQIKDYDDAKTKDEKRTIDSFVEWINYELKNNHSSNQNGGKKSKTKNKNKLKNIKSTKIKTKKNKKHKWSMKYKKSINCKRPKGFSQKQFCKYNKMNIKK